jgi:hypothetical protein
MNTQLPLDQKGWIQGWTTVCWIKLLMLCAFRDSGHVLHQAHGGQMLILAVNQPVVSGSPGGDGDTSCVQLLLGEYRPLLPKPPPSPHTTALFSDREYNGDPDPQPASAPTAAGGSRQGSAPARLRCIRRLVGVHCTEPRRRRITSATGPVRAPLTPGSNRSDTTPTSTRLHKPASHRTMLTNLVQRRTSRQACDCFQPAGYST